MRYKTSKQSGGETGVQPRRVSPEGFSAEEVLGHQEERG